MLDLSVLKLNDRPEAAGLRQPGIGDPEGVEHEEHEEHEEHDKLAGELERETDQLEQRSDELGDEISDVRDDWRRKRSDDAVPGAIPPEPGESESSDG